MNQELLFRLFRSIDGDKNADLFVKVASLIVDDEKRKGHTRLAEKLNSLLVKKHSEPQKFS